MGDSTCLMQGFSYASAIPNESKQGNAMHVLGESISFGRFITEPLSWERWSSFSSHKKYVEEAQMYAQPGSVAQKKAFFEAHYKRVAAQRAAALALLEKQNDAKNGDEEGGDLEREDVLDPQLDAGESVEEEVRVHDEVMTACNPNSIGGNELVVFRGTERDSVKNQDDTISGSDVSGTPHIEEKPLLKNHVASEDEVSSRTTKKRSGLSSLKQPSIPRKTWKVPSTPTNPVTPQFNTVNTTTRKSNMDSMEKKRSSPKRSLHQLINSIPIREPYKEPISGSKETAPTSSRTPKNCRTPWKTPVKLQATATNSGFKYGAATPLSEKRRMVKTPVDIAPGNKTSGPKWNILSSVYSKSVSICRSKLQSPTLSTPFVLRTEERAAKRKQKLEEKFNANEVQKVHQQKPLQVNNEVQKVHQQKTLRVNNEVQKVCQQKTLKEKAGNEIRKLSCGFCFKARPLPEFYKEREMSIINQMKKAPVAGRPQPTVLGKAVASKKQGTVSMPSAPPFPSSLANNGAAPKNLLKKCIPANPSRIASSSSVLHGRLVGENRSPNIQH